MSLKDKLSNAFNAKSGAAAGGALKGINVGLQVASVAVKAGLIAAVAPVAVAAAVGAASLGVGALMAYKGVRKVEEEEDKKVKSKLYGFTP